MKLVHVRTITFSCMVGFENNLAQMIVMTKQCVKCRYVKGLCHILHLNFLDTFQCRPIAWSSILGFINNVAQMIIMTRGCVANKN